MSPRALITGITGQDGSYVAEYLLSQGYEVHGLVRRVAAAERRTRFARIEPILERVTLHAGSLESYASIFTVLSRVRFDECYHLAAQTFVAESFVDGFSTMQTNVMGTHYVLAALQQLQPECRVYFAASSEMFGDATETPQSESTPFHPRNPYGVSKVTGFLLARNFRESYGMFCCSGILFNHESPRRGVEFVTRKVSRAAARIRLGLDTELRLGNLSARRDWGDAREYVQAMHAMLQEKRPDDYVIATGETHSVRELCEVAFGEVGLDYRDFVRVDAAHLRPADVEVLEGDSRRARETFGWRARVRFDALVRDMVAADLELARREQGAS